MRSTPADIDPFSEIAPDYDASFTRLPVVQLLRERIHRLIHRSFPAGGTVLDVACGTGEDATMLAQQGYRVVATDRSEGMLAVARSKSCALPLPPRFIQADAASLTMFRDSSFDAILSNFGGLNCVPNLRSTLQECHRILRPHGSMVLCLLGSTPAWEMASFALRGAWGKAFRRRGPGPVKVRLGTGTVDTWYYSVAALRRSVEGLFQIEGITALNVVAPPPASRSFLDTHSRVSSLLYALDERLEAFPLIRALGDHTVLILRRRD